MTDHEITPKDRALLQAQGMRGVGTGRWVSGWHAQDGNEVSMPGGASLDEPMATGRLMAVDEPDGPVGVPLGILVECTWKRSPRSTTRRSRPRSISAYRTVPSSRSRTPCGP